VKTHPTIIQGGLGVAVSSWKLARAVARLGQLGVVSGTAMDQVFARRLQDGDEGGNMRRGLEGFPFRKMAERVWNKYFIPGGKAPDQPYRQLPMHNRDGPVERCELCIVANYVEVALAREGHENPVGVNYLEKVQIPHLPSLYGAMLAGAGYVLMGAGIPLRIPGALDALAQHQPAAYAMHVAGGEKAENATVTFTPKEFMEGDLPPLRRPYFLAIIASNTLATTMVKKANGRVDGFVVEGPTAGGHNAPPRGKAPLSEAGEPVYGERDEVDLGKLKELGLPFWLAGGYGTPEGLREALAAGAAGVQVGTPFALCEESALREDYKRAILASVLAGEMKVFTDPLASPTGFPFKTVPLKGTVAEAEVYAERPRICDLGYLREAYRLPSVCRRTRSHLPGEGWGRRENDRPQVPVQRAAGQHRPGADSGRRLCRNRAGHLWRLPDRRGQFPDQRGRFLQCRRCDREAARHAGLSGLRAAGSR
jgi:nitronate monooxygenase